MYNCWELYFIIYTICYVVCDGNYVNQSIILETAPNNYGTRGRIIPRDRRHVSSIFGELGAMYARFYRMDKDSFYHLIKLLESKLNHIHRLKRESKEKHQMEIYQTVCT